jgi:hypothetical protein
MDRPGQNRLVIEMRAINGAAGADEYRRAHQAKSKSRFAAGART